MSTRTQIRFVDDAGTAQVYRHSDGYPSSIIPSLARLYRTQRETRMERGAHYTAANYIFFGKLQSMRLQMPKREFLYAATRDEENMDDEQIFRLVQTELDGFEDAAKEDRPSVLPALFPSDLLDHDTHRQTPGPTHLLGYGVEDPADGIHGDENYIYKVRTDSKGRGSGWSVKFTAIGRDDPYDDPFNRSDWDFVGPLEEAVEEYADVEWSQL